MAAALATALWPGAEAAEARIEGVWRDGCLGGRDGLRAALGTSVAACGFESR